jgi:integrase
VTKAESASAPGISIPTLVAFLKTWMEHVRAYRQPDTVRNYRLKCGRFSEELGSTRLDKLRVQQIDELYRRWLGGGMAPSTVKSYHAVLSSALGQAVKWGIVESSIASRVTLPTVEPRRMQVPDADAIRRLVCEAAEDDPVLSAAIVLAGRRSR